MPEQQGSKRCIQQCKWQGVPWHRVAPLRLIGHSPEPHVPTSTPPSPLCLWLWSCCIFRADPAGNNDGFPGLRNVRLQFNLCPSKPIFDHANKSFARSGTQGRPTPTLGYPRVNDPIDDPINNPTTLTPFHLVSLSGQTEAIATRWSFSLLLFPSSSLVMLVESSSDSCNTP